MCLFIYLFVCFSLYRKFWVFLFGVEFSEILRFKLCIWVCLCVFIWWHWLRLRLKTIAHTCITHIYSQTQAHITYFVLKYQCISLNSHIYQLFVLSSCKFYSQIPYLFVFSFLFLCLFVSYKKIQCAFFFINSMSSLIHVQLKSNHILYNFDLLKQNR